MRGAWAAIGLAMGVPGAGCVDLRPFRCTEDADCVSATGSGRCEPASRFCSYPDPDCSTGRRYSDLAGPLSRRCTEPDGAAGSSSASPSPAETTSVAAETSPGTSSSSVDPEGSGSSTAGAEPVCGNGVVEPGEDCDELDGVDGDGCNTDCTAGGAVRWSGIVASENGGADRLFGLTVLASGEVMGAGYFASLGSRDVLLSRWTVDGRETQRVVYDVDGGSDAAEAVVEGDAGDLFVCGRAVIDGIERPWVGRWGPALDPAPLLDRAIPDNALFEGSYDIVYVSDQQVVAVGGTGSWAWAYSFEEDAFDDGELALVVGAVETRFRGAARSPSGELFVAGQVGGVARVYQPQSTTTLGEPLFETVLEVQPQTIEVTDTSIVVGGLMRDGGALDDLWVATYERDGDLRWSYAPAEMAIDEVEDVALDPAGNVYAIGHVTNQNDNPDRWVGKIDPEGQLVWQRSDFPGSEFGSDRGRSIEVLPDGDIIVVGETPALEEDLDGWIARLAP